MAGGPPPLSTALVVASPLPLVPVPRYELVAQNVFITEAKTLGTPQSDSLLPDGFYRSHFASRSLCEPKRGGLPRIGGRTLHEWTRKRNAKQSEALAILDRTTSYALTVRDEREVARAESESLPVIAVDQNASRTANALYQECVDLLDTRAAFLRGDLATLPLSALDPVPAPAGFGSGGVRQTPSPAHGVSAPPHAHTTIARAKTYSGLRGRVEMLRADTAKLNDFFEEVGEIKRQKKANERKGQDHVKHHLETVGTVYRPNSVFERRTLLHDGHRQRAVDAREKAARLEEQRLSRTLLSVNSHEARMAAFAERKQGAQSLDGGVRSSFWCVILHLAASVHTIRRTVETAKGAGDDVVDEREGQQDNPQVTTITGVVVTRKKKALTEVFVQRLKQYIAVKKVKQGLKDWIYISRISTAIRQYKRAALSVQKHMRALFRVRGYRRFLCMMQFEAEVDDLVKQLEKRRQQITKERSSAEKHQDGERRKRCDEKLNALMREKGECRGIPTHVKEEVVDAWTTEKEKQYSDKIVQYLHMREEISKKVDDWMFNRKFVLVSVKAEQGDDARPERDIALSELRKRGEVPEKFCRPVFPVSTSKQDLVKLIYRAIDISRTIVMKRLAKNDLPAPGDNARERAVDSPSSSAKHGRTRMLSPLLSPEALGSPTAYTSGKFSSKLLKKPGSSPQVRKGAPRHVTVSQERAS